MTQPLRTILLFSLALICLSGTLAQGAILELSGPDGARVVVNGRARGFFPLEHPLDLGPGYYQIECRMPGYKEYHWEVFLADESDWKRLHVRLTRYSRKTAVTSNILLAGLGQHYLDKPAKGWVYNIAEVGGLFTALVAEAGRSNFRKDYLLLLDNYNAAISINDLAHYKLKAEEAYQDMTDMESLRDTGLIVAGSAIVLSMLDALIFFPSIDVGSGPGISSLGTDSDQPLGFGPPTATDHFTTIHAGIKLGF